VVADDQNSLRVGDRGPTVLEDFHFREKIFHFDHERIPERVVHARGYGAHGFFENYEPLTELTRADLFQRAGMRAKATNQLTATGRPYHVEQFDGGDLRAERSAALVPVIRDGRDHGPRRHLGCGAGAYPVDQGGQAALLTAAGVEGPGSAMSRC
jgi:hypothetical protein